MEAANQVAAFGEIDAAQVVEGLTSLVDKSLVAADLGDPAPRYWLLETVRAYATGKLAESCEAEAVMRLWLAAGLQGACAEGGEQ